MKYVTLRQALLLRKLGFKEPCMHSAYKFGNMEKWRIDNVGRYATANNKLYPCVIAIPTCDEAIDWIRRKYSIHIVNRIIPFVDPIKQGKVLHAYCVKKCNMRDGWNFRVMLGYKSSHDIYAAKRACITIALKSIQKKAKIVKIRKK